MKPLNNKSTESWFGIENERIRSYEPNNVPLPQAIIKVINGLSTKYAAMFCTSINTNERINALQQHKNEGTIPGNAYELMHSYLFTMMDVLLQVFIKSH